MNQKKIKCLGCGAEMDVPMNLSQWEKAHLRSEEVGFDTTAFCGKVCEEKRLAKAFKALKADPNMLLAHMFGRDKQTHEDRRKFEDSKRSKAAFA